MTSYSSRGICAVFQRRPQVSHCHCSPYCSQRTSPQSQVTVIGGTFTRPIVRIAVAETQDGKWAIESFDAQCYVRDVRADRASRQSRRWNRVAVAVVQEQQLLKTLRWYDGFVIALANPGFLLGSLGYSVGDLGGWGAAMLWGISAVVAVFINTIYSELATMFPEKSGGLALYAHEAWRKYTTLVGPIATFGYWIGWSVVLSVNGLFIGSIIQSTWFSGEPGGSYLADDGYFSVFGLTQFGLPAAIAIVLILGVWLFNVFGARVGVLFGYGAGVLLMVPLFVMMILPFLNGSFDGDNLTNKLNDPGLPWGGLQLALVWLWLMCWSAWGVDVCATFAPEYKDTVRDTKLALRSAALFSMVVYIVLPIGLVGGAGPKLVEAYDFPGAMDKIVGST